jgi:hypothetical protein
MGSFLQMSRDHLPENRKRLLLLAAPQSPRSRRPDISPSLFFWTGRGLVTASLATPPAGTASSAHLGLDS